MVALLRFVTLVALLAVSSAVDNPTVQLPLGALRGTRLKYEGRAYHAYRGVPYAEPPERFKEATRKRPWSEMLDATEDGPSCLQHDAYVDDGDGGEYKGDTDCLFLNVYTPAVKGERGFPIIVYLHGGGYTSGHAGSEWVNPQYFMLKDVVVVTVAYRLGVFGFLCTGDDQALANLGLRDQWLALRWVRAHGPAFGGAADRVTLMGHDAGAASVHLHMLAPASRGLFARAISQSGVWLDWWLGAQQPRQAAATVRALATQLGCYWEPPSLMPCLRSKPIRQLFNATAQFQFWSIEPLSLFRPCVDTATAAPFLPVDPLQLLEDGQVASVPWLLGVTSDQGLFRLADIFSTKSADAREELVKNFDEIMPVVLGLNVSFPSFKVRLAWKQIQLLYYGNSEADPFKHDGRVLSDLYADRFFLHGWKKAIIYHNRFAKADNIYAYVFNYSGSRTFESYYGHEEQMRGVYTWKMTGDTGKFQPDYVTWLSGACHGDDLLHLFEMPKLFPEATTTDKEAIQAMVTLWTNFAKDGYPVANRERPSGEPECWPADKLDAAGAVWPAASEAQPWFVELRGDRSRGERLRACPRLHLPAVDVRLRYWDQLPLAENLNLSLNYHKVQPDPRQDTREYYDAVEEPSSVPRVELHSLLCVFHLLIIRHISPLYSISENDR